MRVINRRIRIEGNAVVVSDNEGRNGVRKFKRGVPAIAGAFKSHK